MFYECSKCNKDCECDLFVIWGIYAYFCCDNRKFSNKLLHYSLGYTNTPERTHTNVIFWRFARIVSDNEKNENFVDNVLVRLNNVRHRIFSQPSVGQWPNLSIWIVCKRSRQSKRKRDSRHRTYIQSAMRSITRYGTNSITNLMHTHRLCRHISRTRVRDEHNKSVCCVLFFTVVHSLSALHASMRVSFHRASNEFSSNCFLLCVKF